MDKPKYRLYRGLGFNHSGRGHPLVVEFEEPQYGRREGAVRRAVGRELVEMVPAGHVLFRRFGLFRALVNMNDGEREPREIIVVCTPTPSAMHGPAICKVWEAVKEEALPILEGTMQPPPGEGWSWYGEKLQFKRGEGDYARHDQPR